LSDDRSRLTDDANKNDWQRLSGRSCKRRLSVGPACYTPRTYELRDQHARWREGLQLREYIAAMDRTIAVLPDGDDLSAAAQWRAWCQEYVEGVLDPLGQPLVMPTIREWTREERQSLEARILRELERASKLRADL
jgi:hypothetical protein